MTLEGIRESSPCPMPPWLLLNWLAALDTVQDAESENQHSIPFPIQSRITWKLRVGKRCRAWLLFHCLSRDCLACSLSEMWIVAFAEPKRPPISHRIWDDFSSPEYKWGKCTHPIRQSSGLHDNSWCYFTSAPNHLLAPPSTLTHFSSE